jgi:molybdate transport repressor ModE-like protein
MNQMRIEDITLNHLKILKVVDECHSFSVAAKKLGYSQALISKKIKQIENYFGTRLLNRSPGSISLTRKGQRLIAEAYPLVNVLEQLQQEFKITLSFEGQEITIGATSLLIDTWLRTYLYRFQLCFPDSITRAEIVPHQQTFSNADLSHLDLLLNSSSAYKEDHHCTRLDTASLVLVSFETLNVSSISLNQIDFSQVILIPEIVQELAKNRTLSQKKLDQALVLSTYQDAIKVAVEHQQRIILPDFCQAHLPSAVQVTPISDAHDYGVYLHVPKFSEPLVVAETLVRSFRLDQERQPIHVPAQAAAQRLALRLAIQRHSVGQLIASYGVKFVAEQLGAEPLFQAEAETIQPVTKLAEIARPFELEIEVLDSSQAICQKMKRGELDFCILDDIALLSNGSACFHDLSFSSRLIGIASYNLLGNDIAIILPRRSPVQSIQDLRGKRIATWFGSNAHRFVIMLFDLYGIDVDTDCVLLDQDPYRARSSLAQAAIDAYICCESVASLIQTSLLTKRLPQSATNLNIPSLRGIVCRTQFIKEHPKSVVSYLHHLMVANAWFLFSPDQAAATISQFTHASAEQIVQFFDPSSGARIDPTLKPQWSWLLKTLNRRLEGHYGISKFDLDFWMDDYLLRLVYSLMNLDYHLHQVSFSSELSNSYFEEEKFNRYMKNIQSRLVS